MINRDEARALFGLSDIGFGLADAAMWVVLRNDDMRDYTGLFDGLRPMRRIPSPYSRSRIAKRPNPTGPTKKRSKVKAARKANLRRIQR